MKEILHLMTWPMMAVGILVSAHHWLPLWIDAVLRSLSSVDISEAVANDPHDVAAGAGILAVDMDNYRYLARQDWKQGQVTIEKSDAQGVQQYSWVAHVGDLDATDALVVGPDQKLP